VEDRTRTYHPRQNIYLRRGPGDQSFERQLPAEIRAELEALEINHQPAGIPTSEQEIQAAIRWLKSQGYLQSGPALSDSGKPPPPVPPSVPVTPSAPAKSTQSASRSGIWLLLAAVLGFPILIGMLSQAVSTLATPSSRPVDGSQPQARPVEVRRALPPPVEVRRALPAVPRALPVTSPVNPPIATPPSAESQPIRMPDGTIVEARYEGEA
jgi:hypothetical protein